MIATIVFFLYLGLIILEMINLFIHFKLFKPIISALLLIISLLLLFVIISRSIAIKFVALTNTFESLLFFSAIISLLLFIYLVVSKNKVQLFILFIGTIIAFILLALASSPLAPNTIKPPIPALQSGWLILHVAFTFIGEAFFAFGFAAAIYYFFVKNSEQRDNVDRLISTAITIGYPIFTTGALIFGAIWAQSAWGSFWSWDPKENFALITWLVYTIYLHVRLFKKVDQKITVLLAIIGFLLTLFTFFGVNYLFSSLHSYG